MKRQMILVGLIAVLGSAASVQAVIYDTIDRAKLRYGDPVFATVIGGRQTYAYKQDQLYLTQTYNEDTECDKAVYARMDKKNLEQDDFEIIFYGEDAQHGTVLSISTPAVRFLQFDNDKVARVTLTDVTFYSKHEFRANYGRVPTQKQMDATMQQRVQSVYERQAEAKRLREAPPPAPVKTTAAKPVVKAKPKTVKPVEKAPEQKPTPTLTDKPKGNSTTSTLVLGLLVGASGVIVAYLLLHKPKEGDHQAHSATPDEPKQEVKLEQPRLKKPEAGRPALSQHKSPRLELKRK